MPRFAIGIVLLLLSASSLAQTPYFQTWTLQEKGEDTPVNVVIQSRDGFIWVGTQNGLFKLDGIESTRFSITDSLAADAVTALAEDSTGRIWVGHSTGELSIIENDIASHVRFEEGNATAPVSDIVFDRDGILWFATKGDGLYYWKDARLFRVDDLEGLPDLFIYDLQLDGQGHLWAGTDGGAAICTLANNKVDVRVVDYQSGLPDNIIKKFAIGEDGQLWMASEDQGVFRYDEKSGDVTRLFTLAWTLGAVNDFLFVNGETWLATGRPGLWSYEENKRVLHHQGGSNVVTALLLDREGNVWAGTKTGLMRSFGTTLQSMNHMDGKERNVLALTVDQENSIWYATPEGLFVKRIDAEGKVSEQNILVGTRFRNHPVISLYADESGFIWAGFYGEGAIRMNARTLQIEYIKNQLRNGNVLSIGGTASETWLSTLGGASRITTQGADFQVRNYTREDGLVSDYIYQTFVDSKKRVWFATDRQGIDRLDGSNMRHFSEGLDSRAIYGLTEDGGHRIWANVQGIGLKLIEGDSLMIPKALGQETNLASLTTDSQGRLVLSSDNGLWIWDTSRNKLWSLRTEAGLENARYNFNAVARDRFDHLYFGTEHGILQYRTIPDEVASAPMPSISFVRSFDRKNNYTGTEELDYNQNDLMFGFTGIWFQNPDALTFRYRLTNYDKDWITTGDHSAVYSKLPPGTYTFEVQVSSRDEFDEAVIASHAFEIKPPFWRTNVFYALSVLTIAFLVYTVITARERRLVKDKVALEKRVRERTLEIQKKNEEIHAQSEEIKSINDNLERMVHERTSELERKNKALEEYAFINAHNLRSPVASILGLIQLLNKLDLDDEGKTVVKHLRDSGERLDGVVKTITEAIERGDTMPYQGSSRSQPSPPSLPLPKE